MLPVAAAGWSEEAPLRTEGLVSGKGTRITVDLGSEDLAKALKIAAVHRGRTVRDIVVEALNRWLESDASAVDDKRVSHHQVGEEKPGGVEDKDYKAMLETLNRYRGLGPR